MKPFILAAMGFVALVAIGMILTAPEPTSGPAGLTETTGPVQTVTVPSDDPFGDATTPLNLSREEFVQLGNDICAVAAKSEDYVEFGDGTIGILDKTGRGFSEQESALLTIAVLTTFCEAEGQRLLG